MPAGDTKHLAVAGAAIFPDLHPLIRDCSPWPRAVKARQAVSSAAPAGRTHLALLSLTAHVRGLLAVAGDELRKDGGNEATYYMRVRQNQLFQTDHTI